MLSKATGRAATPSDTKITKIEDERGADIEALVDAIEPSLRRAHAPINRGAQNIVIVNGDHNTINFDSQTKEYVNATTTDPDIYEKAFSIPSFNVNSGYGRAFDKEEGRTIPFQVVTDAEPNTKAIIASSLQRYATQETPWIHLKHERIVSPNGRIKKLLVSGAQELKG